MSKLLFFDIDGTLAIGKEIPISAKKAIKKVRENGHKVFICTGRGYHYAYKYFSEYVDGFICNNGRFAILNHNVIYNHPIDNKEINTILDILNTYQIDYTLFDQNEAFFNGSDEHFKILEKVWSKDYIKKDKPSSDNNIYSIDIIFDKKEEFYTINDALKDKVILNPHFPILSADMTVIGIDKGSAIESISKTLNINKEDTYAFGDGINDLVMANKVGHMVAMGNAIDLLKEKAEYITTNIDDDGIKNALEYYKLIKE